jgi:hypothetical protein
MTGFGALLNYGEYRLIDCSAPIAVVNVPTIGRLESTQNRR